MTVPRKRFKHSPLVDVSRGRIKLYCSCGAQTKRIFGTLGEAIKAHATHVGIRELQDKDVLA
jgi:hypothetical protein